MARRLRDATLDSRAARAKLKPRGKPFFRVIEQGLHLGYRRLSGRAGTWVARHYVGGQQYEVEGIGIADDLSDANGEQILTYWQAVDAARERMTARTRTGEGTTVAAICVREAVESYIAERDARESRRKGRPVRSDASQRLRRYVLGQTARGQQPAVDPASIADVAMHELDDDDLIDWRGDLPDGMKGATKQRLINDLKAALNAYYSDHRKQLPSTLPATIKHGLKAEREDEAEPVARENQILTDAQVGRLLVAAQEVDDAEDWDGDLFRLVLALAATGARFSQAARMRVADYQPKHGRLLVPFSRKGRNRTAGSTPVPVGQDVLDALYPATVGRKGSGRLLERWRHKQVAGKIGAWERSERGPWHASSEIPWDAIRERAEMPDAIPYALRHSSIVRGIRANLPLRLVAALHDTSVAMIERHYSRWIVDGLEELAAKAVVPLVPKASNVVKLAGRGG